LIALILQATGVASFVVAGFLINPALGFAVLGIGLTLFGIAVERSKRA
jgi:hypothetical protein